MKIMKILLVLLSLAAGITTLLAEADGLRLDFYEQSCPNAEKIVMSQVQNILAQPQFQNAPAQLLRLLFHDCFIEGCDASVLLTDTNGTSVVERQAIPNRTLKGFEFIDMIKEELEKECPGVVSCSDIMVLATRNCILLSGGPYYPVYTGRRDNNQSFFSEALSDIPRPNGKIFEALHLFSLRGFNTRETVALLGAHNIGRISCQFILPRLGTNFLDEGSADSTLRDGFIEEIKLKCQKSNSSFSNTESLVSSLGVTEANWSMSYFEEEFSSSSSQSAFGTHYYQKLMIGRGLLFADQQLMANEETARIVEEYTLDDGTVFRRDFARAMVKMSNLVSLTGSQGQVRLNCSVALKSS
ncbi:putative Peroxidase 48 isoform X1 [Coffea arabica]|uniref:Peroxidase n=1 Tax=Coffea arabica TaxID=13443 RepID=A0A6P6XLU5_COFAR|nr:putative Peroxidase 48 isoform X1 [Coffea arabica]